MADKTLNTTLYKLQCQINSLKKDVGIETINTTNLTNVLFVDPSGDNTTAEKGDIHRPWLTPWGAGQVSSEGDVVKVQKGEYSWDGTNPDIGGSFLNSAWNGDSAKLAIEFDLATDVAVDHANVVPLWTNSEDYDDSGTESLELIITGWPNFTFTTERKALVLASLIDGNKFIGEFGNVIGVGGGTPQFWGRFEVFDLKFKYFENFFRYAIATATQDESKIKIQGDQMMFTTGSGTAGIFDTVGDVAFLGVINNAVVDVNVKELSINTSFSNGSINNCLGGVGRHNTAQTSDGHFTSVVLGKLEVNVTSPTITPYTNAPSHFDCFRIAAIGDNGRGFIKAGRVDTNTCFISTGNMTGVNLDFSNTEMKVEDSFIICTGANAPAIYIHGYGSGYLNLTDNSKIIFKNLTIINTSTFVAGFGEIGFASGGEIIFDNCVLETQNAGSSVIETATDLTFKDCVLLNDGVTNVIDTDGTAVNIRFLGNNYSNGGSVNASVTSLVGTLDTSYV